MILSFILLLLSYAVRCVWLVDNVFVVYILNQRLKIMFVLWQFGSTLMFNGNVKEYFSF